TSVVYSLLVMPNGDVIGGGMQLADGLHVNFIARWDGASWHALGSGVDSEFVLALAVLSNGDLIVGGSFFRAGGLLVNGIARWDGGSWQPLGNAHLAIRTITVLQNDHMV